MDANAVVENLEDKNIIDEGDLSKVAKNENRVQKNQILHRALKQKCTDEALMEACDIIIAVKNRKMTALAKAMKEALVASMCVSVCSVQCMSACILCVYVICWLHVCLCLAGSVP